jgi:hypothetical protein
MAQRFDISSYFTRQQSDARYRLIAKPPLPPTGLTLAGSGVLSNSTDPVAYLDITLTDPATPNWSEVGTYIKSYQFTVTWTNSGVTSTQNFTFDQATSYRLINLPTGTAVSVTAKAVDYLGRVSTSPSAALGTTTPADAVGPSAPTVIAVTQVANGAQVDLNTLNVESDFDHYELWRGRNYTGTWASGPTVVQRWKGSTSIVDTSIPVTAVDYYYFVRALDFSGNFADSNIFGPRSLNSTVIPLIPIPSLLGSSATSQTNGSINFSFYVVSNVTLTKYRIWRRRKGTTSWVLVSEPSVSPGVPGTFYTYSDTLATLGFTYEYSVSAVNTVGGDSDFVATGNPFATAVDTQLPGAPGTITFLGKPGAIEAIWDASSSADIIGYKLVYRLLQSASFPADSQAILTRGNYFLIRGLTQSKSELSSQFEIKVWAVDRSGNESTRTTRVITFPELLGYVIADNSVPPSPLTVTPTANNDGTVTLSWVSPSISDIYGFQIEQKDSVGNIWEILSSTVDVTAGAKSFTAKGLDPFTFAGKTYQFRVRVVDASGNISSFNFVKNPSFESGSLATVPTDWTAAGDAGAIAAQVSTPVNNGIRSLRANYASRPSQIHPVTAGSNYSLSSYVRQDLVVAAPASIRIEWLNGSNAVLSSRTSPVLLTSANFQRVEVNGAAPVGAVNARILLLGDPNIPATTFFWEDAQFEQSLGATAYGDGKTGDVRAVDTVGPQDYYSFGAGLSITAVGALGQINLRWKNPANNYSGAYDYNNGTFEIWRKVTVSTQPSLLVDANFKKIAEVPATPDGALNAYDDLDPDEAYNVTAQYKLLSRDRFGNTGPNTSDPLSSNWIFLNNNVAVSSTSLTANDVNIVTVDTVPPTQPDMTTATILVQDDGSIKLTWNNQSTPDLAGYNIWRRRNGAGESFISAGTIKTSPGGGTVSVVDANPIQLQTYDYTVSAFDKQANESAKDTVNFKTAQSTDTRSPAVPSGLKAKGATASIVCSWLQSTTIGVAEYDFQFSTDNGSSWSTSETVTGTQKIVPFTNAENLASPGFLFRVKSYSTTRGASSSYVTLTVGNRDLTNYLPVDTTAPSPPATLTPALNDNSEVLLSWTASTSADVNRYIIESAFAVSINTVARASNIVTVVNNYAHALNVGDSVTLFEVTDSSFNGTFTVASVIDSKTFTFAQTAADASSTLGFSQSAWQGLSTSPAATLNLRISGLQPFGLGGKIYIFRIFAVDNSNLISLTSTSSTYVGIRLDTTPPGVPTGLAGSFTNEASAVASASISWDENAEIDIGGYEVSYMLSSGDGYETVLTSPRGTTSMVIRGLKQTIAYKFKVRAVDRTGNRSDYGPILTMTSVNPAGASSTATDITATFYSSANIKLGFYVLTTMRTITAPTGVCGTAGVCRTTNVVTLKTSSAHGLVGGDAILVTGVTDAAFNGAFTVSTAPNGTTITYAQTGANANSGNGTVGKPYVHPGDFQNYAVKRQPAKTITAISRTSNVVTVTTSTAHGRVTGEPILITGNATYNGAFVVASTPTSTQLTYSQTASNASGPNSGRLSGEGSQIGTSTVDTYTDTTINQTSSVQFYTYSARVQNTSLLSSVVSNLVEVTIPATSTGGGGIDCPAAEMYVRLGRKAKDVVDGEWLDILVRAKIDVIAQGRVLSTRSSIQPCVLLRGSNGAAVIVSENTPVDDMYGVSLLAKNATGHWLATDVGNGVEWVKFESMPVGDMEVAYIGMGGLTFGAGIDPAKRVFTHNANPGK